MKRGLFNVNQIIGFLKEAESRRQIREIGLSANSKTD